MHPRVRAIAESGGTARRVGFVKLMTAVFALLRTAPAIWLAWIAAVALLVLMRAWGPVLNFPAMGLSQEIGYWAKVTIEALIAAALGAVVLRAWLRPERFWTLESGVAVYMALAAIATIAGAVVRHLVSRTLLGDASGPKMQLAITTAAATYSLVLSGLVGVALLMFWPIARLVGDPRVRPLDAPRLIGWGWVQWLAVVLLAGLAAMLLLGLSMAPLMLRRPEEVQFTILLLEPVGSMVILMFALAAAAALYLVRVRGAGDVAGVFD